MRWARLALAAAAPLLLVSCLLTPGQFTASLDVKRDRSFTFAYQGEAIVAEEQGGATSACADDDPDCETASPADAAAKAAEQEAKLREIGEALGREAGYRSVQFLGNRTFRIDYQVTGTLDRGFIFPFNSDASAILPWIAIELRKDGTARVKAPGFGEEGDRMGPAGASPLGRSTARRQGQFTLTTDAEIVAQNEEGGAVAGPGGGKRIVWRVTPTSTIVPTAVLRF